MYDFSLYVLQLAVVSVLVALAMSIYIDGIGYVVLHVLGITGLGAYTYALLTTQYGWPPIIALIMGAVSGSIGGLLCAEAIRTLRGDGLTLATFGLGVGAFELFRYLKVTGGVYGIGNVPSLIGQNGSLWSIVWPCVIILTAGLGVTIWRKSLGGAIVSSLRLSEWAAISVGARLTAHQRVTGLISGCLAGLAGAYFATATSFIEPRDFRPTSLLLPLAATIIAAGRTPIFVIIAAIGIVTITQSVRFLGGSPALAGPIAEIMVAIVLGASLVGIRLLRKKTDGPDVEISTYPQG